MERDFASYFTNLNFFNSHFTINIVIGYDFL